MPIENQSCKTEQSSTLKKSSRDIGTSSDVQMYTAESFCYLSGTIEKNSKIANSLKDKEEEKMPGAVDMQNQY